MSNAMTACGRRSPGAAMRHDPASAAIVIMLRSLKMHGMSQAVTDLIEQGAPAFEAAVPILSKLLKAELAEREVRSRECLILCVSDLAHAVFRYVQASKRPAKSMAS